MRGGEEPPDGDESGGDKQSRERRAARRKAYPEERDERLSRSSNFVCQPPYMRVSALLPSRDWIRTVGPSMRVSALLNACRGSLLGAKRL